MESLEPAPAGYCTYGYHMARLRDENDQKAIELMEDVGREWAKDDEGALERGNDYLSASQTHHDAANVYREVLAECNMCIGGKVLLGAGVECPNKGRVLKALE